MDPIIINLNGFQHTVWIVLLMVIAVVIYSWTKSKIANSMFSVIITLVIVYLLFIQYPHFVWFAIIAVVISYVNFSDFQKLFKDFKI